MMKTGKTLMLAILSLALPMAAPAQATLLAELGPSVDSDFVPGETFDFTVRVSANTTGQYPAAAVLEIEYDTSAVDFVSADGDASNTDPAWLGDVLAGAEEANGGLMTRDLATFGNLANSTEFTPNLVTVTMQVNPLWTGTPSFGITVRLDSLTVYDPGGATLAFYDTAFATIPVVIDDGALQNLSWQSTVRDWTLYD